MKSILYHSAGYFSFLVSHVEKGSQSYTFLPLFSPSLSFFLLNERILAGKAQASKWESSAERESKALEKCYRATKRRGSEGISLCLSLSLSLSASFSPPLSFFPPLFLSFHSQSRRQQRRLVAWVRALESKELARARSHRGDEGEIKEERNDAWRDTLHKLYQWLKEHCLFFGLIASAQHSAFCMRALYFFPLSSSLSPFLSI